MTHVPETASWPPLQRRLARGARGVAYLAVALSGVAVLVHPPTLASVYLGGWLVIVIGWVALLGGGVSLVGTLFHRWQIEWVAVWWAATAFGGYATLAWTLVANGYSQLGSAASTTVAGCLLVGRGIDLWVFSLQVGRTRKLRRRVEERLGEA